MRFGKQNLIALAALAVLAHALWGGGSSARAEMICLDDRGQSDASIFGTAWDSDSSSNQPSIRASAPAPDCAAAADDDSPRASGNASGTGGSAATNGRVPSRASARETRGARSSATSVGATPATTSADPHYRIFDLSTAVVPSSFTSSLFRPPR
jgi:hypothetical protein